jgi:hemerythrin-like domain-containing protein
MTITEILIAEHRVIKRVLQCLKKIAERCRAEGRLDAESARDAIDFFRNFADGWHHAKEEAQLFPVMESRGIPREQGPIGVMMDEHVAGRERIAAMEQAIDGAAKGETEAVQEFCYHARVYIEMLRQHIEKEDHCLFPMADEALTDSDQWRVLESSARADEANGGDAQHDKYLVIADRLADRYGVPKDALEQNAGHCCG